MKTMSSMVAAPDFGIYEPDATPASSISTDLLATERFEAEG
jgi:hypothetical protein